MSQDDNEIDFLDGLEPDPPAKPKASPPAAPVGEAHATPHPALFHKVLEFAGIALIAAAITAGLVVWKLGPRDNPSPSPGDFDARFVPIGKAYLGDLGLAYGSALEDGAKVLDAGQPITMSEDTHAKAWDTNRKAAFNKRITPELNKVVAQGKDEKTVTPEDRAALARAYRGLAKGVEGK